MTCSITDVLNICKKRRGFFTFLLSESVFGCQTSRAATVIDGIEVILVTVCTVEDGPVEPPLRSGKKYPGLKGAGEAAKKIAEE
jgi:hypothetical protein